MPQRTSAPAPGPRRRADAERSRAAIVDAAVRVLNERPDASVEDVAAAAGVSRQTVYAHFPSRDAVVRAAYDHATGEAMSAMDVADLDSGPPVAALVRLLDAAWQSIARYPLLLRVAPVDQGESVRDRHLPVLDRLERLIVRGQKARVFDRSLPASWLVTVTVSLGDVAGEEVRAGRLAVDQARVLLRRTVLRAVGVADPDSV